MAAGWDRVRLADAGAGTPVTNDVYRCNDSYYCNVAHIPQAAAKTPPAMLHGSVLALAFIHARHL
jgi:hypothetical protein